MCYITSIIVPSISNNYIHSQDIKFGSLINWHVCKRATIMYIHFTSLFLNSSKKIRHTTYRSNLIQTLLGLGHWAQLARLLLGLCDKVQ